MRYVSVSICELLQIRHYEPHALTTQPRTLNKAQTLAINKAEKRCYEIYNARDVIAAKMAPNI